MYHKAIILVPGVILAFVSILSDNSQVQPKNCQETSWKCSLDVDTLLCKIKSIQEHRCRLWYSSLASLPVNSPSTFNLLIMVEQQRQRTEKYWDCLWMDTIKYNIHFLLPHFTKRGKKSERMWRRATEIIWNLGQGPRRKRLKRFSLLSLIKTCRGDFSDYNVWVSPQGENTEQGSHLITKTIIRGDSWKRKPDKFRQESNHILLREKVITIGLHCQRKWRILQLLMASDVDWMSF